MGHRGAQQDALLITETNNVVSMSLDADTGYVESPDDIQGWLLNRTQQAKDLNTGRYIQLISERDCRPIQVFRNGHSSSEVESITEKNISDIARQTEDKAQLLVEQESNTDGRVLWIGIITGIIAITFLLVVWKMVG